MASTYPLKFNRTYALAVGTKDLREDPTGAPISIVPPISIEFECVRKTYSHVNDLTIRIYNLAQNTRNQIRYDFYNSGEIRPLILYAGYSTMPVLPLVFNGNITEAYSVREGNTFITTITALDGGATIANAVTNKSFPKGTSQKAVIQGVLQDIAPYFVSIGAIGNSYSGILARGNTYSGPTADILRDLTGGGFFIDNRQAFVLANDEARQGGIAKIDASTGLLGTPMLRQTTLTFDMLFEPGVQSGQLLELQSTTIGLNT